MAYVVALVWSALVLPDRVPSRTGLLAMFAVVGLLVLVGIPVLTRLLVAGDGTWVNLPQRSKDYWFAPERRAEFRVRFGDDIEGFSGLTGVLMTAVLGLTTWVGATGREELPWWVLAGLVGIFLVATAVWTVRLLRSYRPPTSP